MYNAGLTGGSASHATHKACDGLICVRPGTSSVSSGAEQPREANIDTGPPHRTLDSDAVRLATLEAASPRRLADSLFDCLGLRAAWSCSCCRSSFASEGEREESLNVERCLSPRQTADDGEFGEFGVKDVSAEDGDVESTGTIGDASSDCEQASRSTVDTRGDCADIARALRMRLVSMHVRDEGEWSGQFQYTKTIRIAIPRTGHRVGELPLWRKQSS